MNRVLDYLNSTDPNEIKKEIGFNVKRARKALGMTQKQLAQRAGVSQSCVCKIERGDIQDPGVIVMTKLGSVMYGGLNPWWMQ